MPTVKQTKPTQDRAENRFPEAITITHFLCIFQKWSIQGMYYFGNFQIKMFKKCHLVIFQKVCIVSSKYK